MIRKSDRVIASNRSNGFCKKKKKTFEKISEINFSFDCKNFNRNEFRAPKSIDNINLKVLARIIKKFKFLTTFKFFLENLRP